MAVTFFQAIYTGISYPAAADLILFSLRRCVLSAGHLENKHDCKQDHETDHERDCGVTDQSGNDVGHSRYSRAGKCIGHLCRDMVDMVALGTGTRHDSGIRNG